MIYCDYDSFNQQLITLNTNKKLVYGERIVMTDHTLVLANSF